MHELPITQSLLDITLRHANAAGAVRVTQIRVKIGQLSSVVDDSVQFYWNIIAKDTCAQEAELVFERIPAGFHCAACGHSAVLQKAEDYHCPECGSPDLVLDGGEELYIDSIEVE
jgi:hydrogenase nickel incorporation protein HypA/HybF